MKNLFILFLVFSFFVANAQTDKELLQTKLKEELEYVKGEKAKIKNITVFDDGNWIVFYGEIGYSYSALPEKAEKRLKELNENQKLIKDFEVVGESWITISQNNAYTVYIADNQLVKTLKKLNKEGKKINDLDFSETGGWVILFGKAGFASSKISEKANKKLIHLKKKKKTTRRIELCGNEGYIIFYNDGFVYQDIPKALEERLIELEKEKHTINFVKFFGNNWIIIYDDYFYEINF